MLNWFSGKSKSNLPEPTALQSHRTRQIEQLKAFNQNVSEIVRDVEYRVNATVNGTTISLHITLPPQFPQEKPVVKVSPRLGHSWVNDQMIVSGSPGINNFVLHSDLGKVIREIVEEFHRNPPAMLPQQYGYGGYQYGSNPSVSSGSNPPPSTMPQPPAYTYGAPATQQPNLPTYPPPTSTHQPNLSNYQPPASQHQPTYPPQSNQQPNLPSYIANLPMSLPQASATVGAKPIISSAYSKGEGPPNFGMPVMDTVLGHSQLAQQSASSGGYKMPEVPPSLKPHLQHLGVLELQELLDDEDALLQMVGEMPEIQKIAADREHFTDLNEKIARNNLTWKPMLEDKKKVLLEKYDMFNDVKQQYDHHAQRQDELRQKYSHQHILDILKVAALQAEELSEGVAESFLEGKISVDQFKKNYMDKRKLSHLRHAKVERLTQM